MTPAEFLALSGERDLARRLRHGYWAEGYRLGRERGWREGYEQAAADLGRDWQAFTRPTAQRLAAEHGLMLRRWGPGGREHFGDPRPGDFPGRGAGGGDHT